MKKINAIRRFDHTQLMVLNHEGAPEFSSFARIEDHLRPEDLLVMNLSGTVPGSLWGQKEDGQILEIRLAAFAGRDLRDLREWWAIAFGAGNWEMPTEERGPPPALSAGDILTTNSGLRLKVLSADPKHPRLLKISFMGEGYLEMLYRQAAPIQYSYQAEALKLWDVQTPIAQIPLSVEAPSALFPFSWSRLLDLQSKFRIAYLYHGAGISSTGEAGLDERLPLPEFYSIPRETVRAWRHTRRRGGRIIAIGTSVARALESAEAIGEGELRPMEGTTTLRVDKSRVMHNVDGMLTGYHDPLTSHFELEAAFVGEIPLAEAFAEARERGFQKHEFGDATLLLKK